MEKSSRTLKGMVLLPVAFLFLFATCKKNSNEDFISGRIVHKSCASTVVEITDPDFYNLAQDDWQQTQGGPVLHHVFSVTNPCQLPALDSGEVFKFRIINPAGKNDCVVCMMFDNPPQKKHFITVSR